MIHHHFLEEIAMLGHAPFGQKKRFWIAKKIWFL